MDRRILKTALSIFVAIIFGLLLPIFGQWYQQKTGMIPFSLNILGGFGGAAITFLNIAKIWGGIE